MAGSQTCKVILTVGILLVGCAVALAQEPGPPGAGTFEVGGFPGGGMWLTGGDDNTEVDFNTYDFGGYASWYFHPMVALEAQADFGLGLSQNVNYKNEIVYRVQMPHTLGISGDVLFFPMGSARRVAGYVAGGVGALRLYSRTAASRLFGLTENETFMSTNVGAGVKIFRRDDHLNWGFRIDYRILMVNENSDAVPLFAQSKGRMGHRFYIGLLYTVKR